MIRYLLVIALTVGYCTYVSCKDVIVIGAGMAGCTAARELLRNGGYNVTILEADPDRYGGRMWTRFDLLSNGAPVDLGASWIQSPGLTNSIYMLALKHGVEMHETPLEDQAIWNTTGWRYTDLQLLQGTAQFIQLMSNITQASADYEEDVSVYDAIIREGYYDFYSSQPLVLYNTGLMEQLYGLPLQNVSVWSLAHRLTTGSRAALNNTIPEDDVVLPNGYKEILDLIVQGDTGEPNLDIRLGQEVVSIEIDDFTEQPHIMTSSGEEYIADYVVVTVSLGVLKAGAITFSPELPEDKLEAISRMGFGNFNKLMIEFENLFWDGEQTFLGVAPNGEFMQGMATFWVNLYPISGVPALITFMGGDEAYISEDLTDEQVLKSGLERLSSMYGDMVHDQTVVNYARTRWGSNPYTRGTWSDYKVGFAASDGDTLAEPVCPGMFFAGEHTTHDISGTVNGAHDSGWRAARQIITDYCNSAKN